MMHGQQNVKNLCNYYVLEKNKWNHNTVRN